MGWIAATMLLATTLMLPAYRVGAEEPIGQVERIIGRGTITSESAERPAAGGSKIRPGDLLQTGEDGRLVVAFKDGTRLQMGPETRIEVAGFSMEQGRRPGAIKLVLAEGVLRLLATAAVNAPAKRIEVRHAAGTVTADNGADFWCGPQDGQLAVLVLSGRVRVANWSGLVVVERRRAGTLVANLITAPEPAYGWDRDRIRRALASVGGD